MNKKLAFIVSVILGVAFSVFIAGSQTMPQLQQWLPSGNFLIPRNNQNVGTSTTNYYGSGVNLTGVGVPDPLSVNSLTATSGTIGFLTVTGTSTFDSLTATSASIGTITISSLAVSPLIVGGSATTTIYGDGSISAFGGGISATTGAFSSTSTFPGSGIWDSLGNVGIGTTTPASLFTVATTTNIFRVQSNGNILFGSNGGNIAQASSTAWTMNVPLNTGNIVTVADLGIHTLYNQPVSASVLATGTPVGAVFSIDSNPVFMVYGESNWIGGAKNFRVGIGTTTPAFTLDVAGTVHLRGTTTPSMIGLIIDSNGNIGIGTTTPSQRLTVIGTSTNPLFGLYTSSTVSALYVDTNGKVGIGTTAPATKLQVNGTVTASAYNLADAQDKNYNLGKYAEGTVYSLTITPALLNFGTSDPQITIDKAGTYLIIARANLQYNAATFAASSMITLKLRRENNTPADITNSSTSILSPTIASAATRLCAVLNLPAVVYTTSNTDDIIAIYGSYSVATTGGTLDAIEAELVAIRLY